jgi:hypothetical protein
VVFLSSGVVIGGLSLLFLQQRYPCLSEQRVVCRCVWTRLCCLLFS